MKNFQDKCIFKQYVSFYFKYMLCTFFANFRNLLRRNTPKFKAIGPIVNLKKVIYNLLNIWTIKKAESFQTVVLEKTLESPLEAPILWPSDAKSQLIGKDPDAGKD